MTREEKSGFTNRITTANSTGIIAILFDMYLCYTDDAKTAIKKGRDEKNLKAYTAALRSASAVLRHLKGALDFKYEISGNLYAIYDFCERALARAMYSLNLKEIDDTIRVMDMIGDSFREIARNDDSPALMGHTEKVSAGFTYGRADVNETVNMDTNRGFFV